MCRNMLKISNIQLHEAFLYVSCNYVCGDKLGKIANVSVKDNNPMLNLMSVGI